MSFGTPTTCPAPHDVNNQYPWSSSGTAADGPAFTDFLVKLNDGTGFAGHTVWRLPSEEGQNSPFTGPKELSSILLAPCPGGGRPCIDTIFGPTAVSFYWSFSTCEYLLSRAALLVYFDDGGGYGDYKTTPRYVRAVRGGPAAATAHARAAGLTASKADGTNVLVSWNSLPGAISYDVVRGGLSALRGSGGDFQSATQVCAAANTPATSFTTGENPPAGDGHWFLVRGRNCVGNGTYDSGAPSQVGLRDAEIAASGNGCP